MILLGLSFALVRVEQMFPGVVALLPVIGAVLVIASGRDIALKKLVFSNRLAIAVGLIRSPQYL